MFTKIVKQWLRTIYPPLSLVLLALLMSISANTQAIEVHSALHLAAKRPDAPDNGTPSGDSTPGGTRPEAQCPDTEKPLTAISQNQGQDFTVSEYPTFFFYIPYSPEQVESIEFLLLNKTERQTIYRTDIQLTQGPGIIQIKIPAQPQYSLKLDEDYRWRLNLDCKPEQTIEPDQTVNGWVRRLSENPELRNRLSTEEPSYIAYQNNQIWYSAIASLAELVLANPNNLELDKAWSELLQSLGYEWVILEPFVESEPSQLQPTSY
ncbi:MAG: DUF928 domain-containing protein [Cyanobacteria bacterium J06592_8]